ncbi:AMP-dependent synthetase/ligase [Leptolyngbya ectocarpi]|uniref:AMP-dependent synthetase/ligase n=1 Tax=Leptolyngbya ectocarpi TaxID=1202 RepID=UPI002AD47C96|nr:AMP-binding protein [Leptolyngbya ectocarpi]
MQLHYTIPDFLDMGCAYDPIPALNHWSGHGWETYAFTEFRNASEEFALGLKSQNIRWDRRSQAAIRIGLLLENGLYWALADMGSLLAGWVTVPIDGLQALVVSEWRTVERLHSYLQRIKLIVIVNEADPGNASGFLNKDCVVTPLTDLRCQGRHRFSSKAVQSLRDTLHPEDLATIVYTADASDLAKGAMLSHQSLTGNIWAAFSSMPGLLPGTPEVALSFLPLNHIFARTFLYGHFGFGHSIYFSSPKRVFRHLATVKPTIFITVPRLLEKVYERLNSSRRQSSGLRHFWLNWGWDWAHRYQPDHAHGARSLLRRWLLRNGILRTIHQAFGGNIRYLLSGGAALRPEVMTFFNAVGLPVKQGYGLTETSSVLSYTRDRWLRSGTVGAPIPGVEMRLASDGEVLVKSLYTMEGYHHNPAATDAVIDADGWFHTGDLGKFSEDGLLTLRGCKKELFKLSTGKYVAPGPIEARLERSPLVKQALIVGPGQKFCGVLIVPGLIESAGSMRPGEPSGGLRSQVQTLIDQVNTGLSHWSTIKRFALVDAKAAVEDSREGRYRAYAKEIESLYSETEPGRQLPRRKLANVA